MLPQTDTPETNPTDDPVFNHLIRERKQEQEADEKLRRDPHLRFSAVSFIADFGDLLHEHAYQMAFMDAESTNTEIDPFKADEYADLLLWLVSEFLGNTRIGRQSFEYEQMVRHHQLTSEHAAFVFEVPLSNEGLPTMRGMDES